MQALTPFGSDPDELLFRFCEPNEERNGGLAKMFSSCDLAVGAFLRGLLGDLLAIIEATDCTGGWAEFGVFDKGGITCFVAMRGEFTSTGYNSDCQYIIMRFTKPSDLFKKRGEREKKISEFARYLGHSGNNWCAGELIGVFRGL